MTIRTRPSTAAYAAGWDRIFGGRSRGNSVAKRRTYPSFPRPADFQDPSPQMRADRDTMDQLSKLWEREHAERSR